MSKIQPIVIFVKLEEVHRRANKMTRDEEAALGEDVTWAERGESWRRRTASRFTKWRRHWISIGSAAIQAVPQYWNQRAFAETSRGLVLTDKIKYIFTPWGVNFWNWLPQEAVEADRIVRIRERLHKITNKSQTKSLEINTKWPRQGYPL